MINVPEKERERERKRERREGNVDFTSKPHVYS